MAILTAGARAQARGSIETSGRAASVATATEGFGLDLLGEQPPGNVVLSPDSIATALAMAGTGARGQTAEQIATTLGLRGPVAFDSVGNLQRRMIGAQSEDADARPYAPTLAMADGLFVQEGFPLGTAFGGGLQQHFDAVPEVMNFAGDPAGALAAINSWGSDHTDGLIPEMLSDLAPETRLVLADSVYLKARWRYEFEKSHTFPALFHRASGKRAKTEFMHQTRRLLYGVGPGYKAVELPYRASTLSLLAVLPIRSGVPSLEERLREDGLSRVVLGLAPQRVKMSLPRFHLRTQVELRQALETLGMRAPFGPAADFSGITAAEPLKIARVEHVTDIAVDEEGTEAAATTTAALTPRSKEVSRRKPVTFDANRPFLFFVRDDRTGAMLFAGRLTDPAAAAVG